MWSCLLVNGSYIIDLRLAFSHKSQEALFYNGLGAFVLLAIFYSSAFAGEALARYLIGAFTAWAVAMLTAVSLYLLSRSRWQGMPADRLQLLLWRVRVCSALAVLAWFGFGILAHPSIITIMAFAGAGIMSHGLYMRDNYLYADASGHVRSSPSAVASPA